MIIFKGAQWWNAQISTIGDDRTPLIIIDNFFRQPDILLEDAAQKSFTANARYYPGVGAPVPQAYFTPLINALSDVLANVFGYQKGVDLQECNYSLVTTSGRDLIWYNVYRILMAAMIEKYHFYIIYVEQNMEILPSINSAVQVLNPFLIIVLKNIKPQLRLITLQ